MKIVKRFFASFFLVVFVLVFSGCGVAVSEPTYSISLEIWGLFDDSGAYSSVIEEYLKLNPYVKEIKYKKLSTVTYKKDIVEAMAAGQGPDIILISNNWLPYFVNKLSPAPAAVITPAEYKSNFVDVVNNDFMSYGGIYGAPLSVDSLALFYNKDMFNIAGITAPPKTWDEFDNIVKKLSSVDQNGNILRSGAAMGTAQNINRAVDILSLLMMQFGIKMPSAADPKAVFGESVSSIGLQRNVSGADVLAYYTNFAKLNLSQSNTQNPYYCWNFRTHYSVDAFTEGSAAMMINYSWQIETIRKQNPKMNFAVADVPQVSLENPVNIANYWGYAVTKNKMELVKGANGASQFAALSQAKNDARIHEAWQFLKFLTMKNGGTLKLTNAVSKNTKSFPIAIDPALDYARSTNKPAARYDIIGAQKADPFLASFANGNLIAKSWYKVDADASDAIFSEMIDSVVKGEASLQDAIKLGADKINSINVR
jgi:multiple sugar transport system substrate-binding protein